VRKIYEKKSRDEDEAKSATVQERGDVRIYWLAPFVEPVTTYSPPFAHAPVSQLRNEAILGMPQSQGGLVV
jgi:hypothetical protein